MVVEINKQEELTEEEKLELQREKQNKQKNLIDHVIKGVNDIWEKDYDFTELGIPNFHISIKAPNALEQGKIQGMRERYLDGMGSLVSSDVYIAFHALATIRVCGVEIPKLLENDEDIYNTAMLVLIGKDFQEWLNSFRF